jgi:hypothetical protein
MDIRIEINCDDDELHSNFSNELPRILGTIPEKILSQLIRDGRCLCTALESSDKLLDINGNTVGTVKVLNRKGR